jgi:putative DNA primase/helicase
MALNKHPNRLILPSRNKTAPEPAVLKFALEWHRFGAGIVPLDVKSKKPARGYSSKKLLASAADIRRYFTANPKANYGITTGSKSGIIVLDVDGKQGKASLRALTEESGPLPKTTTVETGRGTHYYFKCDGTVIKNSAGKLGSGLDMRGDGGYVVGPGSRHPNGHVYKYRSKLSLSKAPLATIPGWLVTKAIAAKLKPKPENLSPPTIDGTFVPEGGRNNYLASYAGGLVGRGISGDDLRTLVMVENQRACNPPLDGEEVEKIIASISRYPSNPAVTDPGEELANEVLAAYYAGGAHLLNASDDRLWAYDGKRWFLLPKQVLRRNILQQSRTRQRARTPTASVLRQVEDILKAQVATSEDLLRFNASPRPVINCRNGEVWIKKDGSRELRPHSATSYLRHYIDVDYEPKAKARLYRRTVREIFAKAPDRDEVVRFWHELMGYIIQPDRRLPIIAILKGGGSNGKTQLANTLSRLLGEDLVCAMRVEDLNRSQFSTASLLGKFLVLDDDVKAGIRLPDGDLKRISEQKMITGERKFGEPFSFTVRTVPMLLCNNPPSLADLSHGMQRRLMVLPFDRQFSEDEIDRTRFPKIWKRELSGILNLALDGLQRVVRRGWKIDLPRSVADAKQAWMREANPLPDFIAERCEKKGKCSAAKLYSAYSTWSQKVGMTMTMQQRSFKRNLEHLGFRAVHGRDGSEVRGLSLKFDTDAAPRANHWV